MTTPTPTGQSDQSSGAKLSGGVIASGLGIGSLAVFMAQNTDDVNVSFLFWEFTISVWLLTLASAIVGAVV